MKPKEMDPLRERRDRLDVEASRLASLDVAGRKITVSYLICFRRFFQLGHMRPFTSPQISEFAILPTYLREFTRARRTDTIYGEVFYSPQRTFA